MFGTPSVASLLVPLQEGVPAGGGSSKTFRHSGHQQRNKELVVT